MVDMFHFACTRKGLNSTGKCSISHVLLLPIILTSHGTRMSMGLKLNEESFQRHLMGNCKEDLWFLFLSWKCWACKFCQPHLCTIFSPPACMHSHPCSLDSSAVERNEAIRVTPHVEKPRVWWEWMTFISLISVVHKSSSIYIIPFIFISEPINISDFL